MPGIGPSVSTSVLTYTSLIVFAPICQLREGVIKRDFRGFLRLLLVIAPLLIVSAILAAILLAILSAILSAFRLRRRRFFARLFADDLAIILHRQGDLVFLQIDLDHPDRDAVSRADHFARVFNEAVTEPRDVNEAVLVHADVDKGAEVGDVGH